MISFKGAHFPKDVILYAVFFYVRYGVSYRDLEAIMEERGVKVDHSSLNRWVINYSSSLALAAKKLKRAVDKFGDTIDFILSEHRDEAAATAFFKQAIDGIETAHMIRKGQLSEENIPAYKQFMALAG
jgi:putative transposase